MVEKTIATVRVIEDNWHGYKFTDLLIMNKYNLSAEMRLVGHEMRPNFKMLKI